MAEVATAFVSLIPSFKGGKKRIERELSGIVVPAGKTGGQRGGLAAGAALAAGIKKVGLPAVAAVGATLGVALTKGFGRLTAIEDAEAKLRGLGHSAKTVDLIMKNALDSVKGTAFGLDEAASLSATAVAAGIKPGKDLRRILGLIADSATIAGTDLADMGSIWNQVAASGRVSMEEMNRLLDRGIPVLNFLADHFGTTVADIRDRISEGEISFRDFAKAMEENLAGAAVKSGNTTRGSLRNMMAAISRFGAALLSGVFPMIRKAFQGAIVWIDRATEAVQPFAEAFGKSLGPAMREGLKYVKAFVNGLQGGSAGGGGLIVTLNEIGGAIRRFVQGLLQIGQGPGGGVLSFVKSLKSAFDTIFPAVRNFVATIMPTLTDFGQRLVSLVGPALRSIGNIIKSELAPAIAGILPVLAPVAKFLLGVLGDMVIGVLGGVINVIKGVLRVLAGLLTFLTGVFTGDWSKAWDGIKKIAQGVWDVLQGAFKILINVGFVKAFRLGGTLLVKLAGKIWPAIQRLFDKGLVQVAFIVGRGVGVVLNFFKRLPGQALGALKGLGSRIASLFRSAWNAAKSAVSAGVNAVLGLVRGLPGKIKAAVGNLGTVLVESGRALIRGLISGITSMVKNLMSTLKGITSKLPDWKGPMSVDMKILEPSGKAVLQGFVAGIRDALPSLRSELESITADLPAMAAPRRAPAVAAAGGGVTYVFNGRNIDIDEKTIGPVLHAMQLRSRMRRPS